MYVDIHAQHVNHTMSAICLGVIFEKVDDVFLNIKKWIQKYQVEKYVPTKRSN